MILETIAVISAANSAFATIKEAVQNGQDLMACGSQLAEYFGAKSEIQKRAQEKGKSDLELFMANEQLKQREQELKEMMIYQGRGGMWTDWLEWQSKAKREREEAEKEAKRKRMARRKAIKTGFIIIGAVIGVFTAVGLAAYMVYWMVSLRGR
jgi:hypothetical protein